MITMHANYCHQLALVPVHRQQQQACTKPSPLPVFNDSSYYAAALAAKTTDELRKQVILAAQKGFIDLSYDCMWTVLTEADTDPSNSSNVELMYTRQSLPKTRINTLHREHVWPKSHGFPKETDLPYCDAHHLRLANAQVNNRRSDKDFANGGSEICLLPFGAADSECTLYSFDTSTTFEVPLFHRGDAARMIFYLETHYGTTDYDLQIVSTSTFRLQLPKLAYRCVLYQWHREDPVSAFERQRNKVVWYYQGNRNPYIDHPEFVERLYSGSC